MSIYFSFNSFFIYLISNFKGIIEPKFFCVTPKIFKGHHYFLHILEAIKPEKHEPKGVASVRNFSIFCTAKRKIATELLI